MDPLVGLRPPITDDDLLCPEEAPQDLGRLQRELVTHDDLAPRSFQPHLRLRLMGPSVRSTRTDRVEVATYTERRHGSRTVGTQAQWYCCRSTGIHRVEAATPSTPLSRPPSAPRRPRPPLFSSK